MHILEPSSKLEPAQLVEGQVGSELDATEHLGWTSQGESGPSGDGGLRDVKWCLVGALFRFESFKIEATEAFVEEAISAQDGDPHCSIAS